MVVTRSATDAARRVTLLVTARKAVASATVVVVVASLVVKPATLAVVSATWLATAHRARSATTVVNLDTFPATVLRRPVANEYATDASNQAIFSLLVPVKAVIVS